MDLVDLCRYFSRQKTLKKFLNLADLPSTIEIAERIIKKIRNIYSYIKDNPDSLQHEFVVGYILFVGGQILITEPEPVNKNKIFSGTHISKVDYEISSYQPAVKLKLKINDKLYSTEDFEFEHWTSQDASFDTNIFSLGMIYTHTQNHFKESENYPFFDSKILSIFELKRYFFIILITGQDIWMTFSLKKDRFKFHADLLTNIQKEMDLSYEKNLNVRDAIIYTIIESEELLGDLVFYYGTISKNLTLINRNNFQKNYEKYLSKKLKANIQKVIIRSDQFSIQQSDKDLKTILLDIKPEELENKPFNLRNEEKITELKKRISKEKKEKLVLLLVAVLTILVTLLSVVFILVYL